MTERHTTAVTEAPISVVPSRLIGSIIFQARIEADNELLAGEKGSTFDHSDHSNSGGHSNSPL